MWEAGKGRPPAGAPTCRTACETGATRLLVASGFVTAMWAVAASRWLTTDTVVPWDSKNQFYAFYRFLASVIHSGDSPFWNPYHYGGHPSVADPQSLIFAPLFVLWAFFDGAPSLRTFDLIVYAHLLIGGLAICAIGWRAHWPVAGCVLGAALFMFGGAAAGRLQHTGAILSYGLFPLALLLLQLSLERRSVLVAGLFAVVAATITLGRNQVALLLSFALIAFALAEIVSADHPMRYLRERAYALITMSVVGFALVALPLLLTLQFAALSNRSTIDLDMAHLGSLYPANLAQLVVADIFGSHGTYWGPDGAKMPEVSLTDDSFNYLFVGSIPIILLLWFGVAGGGLISRGRRMMAALLAVSLLYALGRYTPVFSWAFHWLPGASRFRRPVDADFVLLAAMAILVGYLLADYVRDGIPRRRVMALLLVGTGAVAAIGAAVLLSARFDHGWDAMAAVLKTAPIPIAAIAILTFAHSARARAVAAALVTVIAVGELLWWNTAFRLNAESSANYAALDQPRSGDANAFDVLERALHERHQMGERPRVEILGMGGPWQNLAVVRSLEATNGYNPLRIGIYDRLVAPGEENWRTSFRQFPATFEGYDCALAHALGLEFIVLDRPIELMPQAERRPIADILKSGPDVWIYRLRNPAPRLKFTRRIQVADADATKSDGQLLVNPSPDRVLIDDDTPPSSRYDFAALGANAGRARIVTWRPDRVDIEAESDFGGMLALHDTWYPGWVAEIDGVRAPILRADVLFRGLELPPGRHRVVFRFEPFGLDNLRDAIKLVFHRTR